MEHITPVWATDADLCVRFEFPWVKTYGDASDIDSQVKVLSAVKAHFLNQGIDPKRFQRWGFDLQILRQHGRADVDNHFKIVTDPLSHEWQRGLSRRVKNPPGPELLKDLGWYLYEDDNLDHVWAVSAQGHKVNRPEDERLVVWIYGWRAPGLHHE